MALTASEEVAEAIRAWILERKLQPGDRLGREADLAARFGVSRPTVREALRLLSLTRSTKGPGGGIFVAATPEGQLGRAVSDSVTSLFASDGMDLRELLETRMLIEIPLAGLAAVRATEPDLNALRSILRDSSEDDGEPSLERLPAAVADIAGNRLAGALLQWVADVLQPSLRELLAPAIVPTVVQQQHEDLLRAIERGDAPGAERAMREHLVYLDDVVAALAHRA